MSATRGAAFSTPTKQTPQTPRIESPGNWRHPRLNEIVQRRQKCTFTDRNLRQIGQGVLWLVVLWGMQWMGRRAFNPEFFPTYVLTTLSYLFILLQVIPVLSIILALLPLIRPEDDLSDIPLTPAQRKLLGLPPSSVPPTPDAKYCTPPRYSRTPSLAGSAASKASYTSSPMSGRGSPAVPGSGGNNGGNNGSRAGSGSPFSPVASPLGQKGFNPARNGNRRSSLGSASPLGALGGSGNASLFSDPASPSPTTGKRTSVGLNNKWLYEKGRRSSGSGWMQ